MRDMNMKRKSNGIKSRMAVLSLALIFAVLIGAFASCSEPESPAVSEANPSAVSERESSAEQSAEDSSGNSSEEVSVPPFEPLDTAKIDAAYTGAIPAEPIYTDVALGKSYSFNLTPHKNYPDDGVKLTDSVEPGLTDNEGWVAFLGRKDIEITVDLGGIVNDLGGFSVNFCYDTQSGRGVTKNCKLYVSENGTDFVNIATSARYPAAMGSSRIYTMSAYTQEKFSAAYVKIVLTDFVTQWVFIDSLRVYGVTQGKTETREYYINEPMPENVTPSYWNADDSDYTKKINLISGLGQRIYSGISIADDLRTDYYNTPASAKKLTDGKRGGNSYSDFAYFHITKAYRRSVIYDIGHISAVTDAVVGIYAMSEYGIIYPDSMSVFVSEDGVGWQSVAYKTAGQLPTLIQGRTDVALDFGGSYKARFVQFVFTVSSHFWLDELEVYGTKQVKSDAKSVVPESGNGIEKGYPSLDTLGGCENILLAYNYKVENYDLARTTKESYLPYVGYYNTDGELTDYFFDSFLYLPCSTVCPSGGSLFSSAKIPAVMTDWIDYENDLFFPERNVYALEEAVGEVSDALGDSDYQAKVFLSIFNPNPLCKDFGDVDGDGKSENLTVLADRKKVVKWWIDRQLARYTACNFENQKLVGFYWYDESLDFTNKLNQDTLRYVIDYVHSLGYYIIWIPYHQAAGYTEWENAGFDIANMQPNYMFNENRTIDLVHDNAVLSRVFGMGVEIEIDGKAINTVEYFERYLAYLRLGVEYGYMNSVKMYYQDAGPGIYYSAYKSTDPRIRSIYDITYRYAKRILTVGVPDPEHTVFETAANIVLEGALIATGGKPYSTANIVFVPKYGSVSCNEKGEFVYTPLPGFTGTDTFVMNLTEGIGSTISTITVNVTK